MHILNIEIFGITFRVETDSPYVYEHLSKDFFLYKKKITSDAKSLVSLTTLHQLPPFDRVPAVEDSLHSFGFITYKDKNVHYTAYSSEGLLIYDFTKEKIEIFGEDDFFIYEKTKLAVLSRLGQLSDRQRLHRIHAFAVSLHNKSLLCILPMEGGKTTTVLNLLKKEPNLKIITDDVCFIDPKGYIRPFLLRIGARDKALVEGIPAPFVDEIPRPYYGVKYFINPELFQKNLLEAPLPLNYILIGKRTFRQETSIEKIFSLRCVPALLKNLMIAQDLPQLEEFFLRRDWPWVWQRLKAYASRFLLCIRLLLKTNFFIIKIGRNKKSTCEEILKLLK